ncbi:MAG: hypothetical protein QM791_15340 [Ferruginibacter sp.]
MKKLLIIFAFNFSLHTSYAQSVGIGTNSPNASAQLDVTSTSKGLLIPRMTTAQRTAIASPANGLMVYDTNFNAFYFYNGTAWNAVNNGGGGSSWSVSGNNIFNSNSGNVGIGFNSGLKEKLSVKGNLFITHTNPNDITNGGNSATINIHPANVGYARVNFLNPDTTVGAYITYYRLSNLVNQFSLNHGSNTTQLCLDDNGNVGVGRSAAVEKLDVEGNIRTRKHLLADSNVTVKGKVDVAGRVDAGGVIEGAGLSSTGTLYVNKTALIGGAVTGSTTGLFYGNITSYEGMTINDAAGTFSYTTGGDDKAFTQLSGNDLRVGTYSTNTDGRFIVRTGGANHLTVNPDGKTGIDIEDAAAKLHINSGASAEALRLQGNTNTIIRFMSGTTEKAYIYAVNNDLNISTVQPGGILRFNTELYVDKDLGRVGVGTVYPQQKLHVLGNAIVTGNLRVGAVEVPTGYKMAVDGKLICEEVRVRLTSGWPDYVFEKNYELPSLENVQQYIKENKHLPNIPSAAEVEKDGITVGEMQKKMMEKIEELTLYIIDLKKEIDILKNK